MTKKYTLKIIGLPETYSSPYLKVLERWRLKYFKFRPAIIITKYK